MDEILLAPGFQPGLEYSPPESGCCKTRETCAVAHASAEADAYNLLLRCRRRLQPARPRSGGLGFCNTLESGGEFGLMKRRTFLRNTGVAAIGFGFSGCATPKTARVPVASAAPHRTVDLPLIDASWDRVIRTTVGLRPHRDSGFRLQTDKL